MKYLSILLVLICLLSGCEQPVDETGFPYFPQIVIRSLVQENRVLDSIYIGKTLPVGVKFDFQMAQIKNAGGVILANGKTYPLRHTGSGYYTTDSLVVVKGVTLDLLVNWDGKTAYASTKVPHSGAITKPVFISKMKNNKPYTALKSVVSPYETEAYGATWIIMGFNNQIIHQAEKFQSVIKGTAGGSGNNVTVETTEIPANFLQGTIGYPGIRIFIYDQQFYDYYYSISGSVSGDAIFGQPGGNVKWNVKGDGIGMFIARTDTIILL